MIRQLFFKFFPLLFGIHLCFFSAITHATPTTFSTEVFIAISSGTSSYPLSGIYDIQFELLDSDDELVFSKSYTTSISLGVLILTVEEDDELDLTLFYDSIVSIRITISDPSILSVSSLNVSPSSFTGTEVINIDFNSMSRAILSNSSIEAERFYYDDVFFIDADTSVEGVAIATTNIMDDLHVNGTISGTSFIGNAENLSNLNYIRWVTLYDRIYYNDGNVGIGLQSPQALLHVYGDVDIKENLYIKDTLFGTFEGDAQEIYNFNASNFSTGIVGSDYIFGQYFNLNGVGTLSNGVWTGGIIAADFINSAQTIHDSIFIDFNVSGNIQLISAIDISSYDYLFNFSTSTWSLLEHSAFVTINTIQDLAIGSPITEYSTSMNINTIDGANILMNISGNVGINIDATAAELTITSGILVGDTDIEVPGIFRFNHDTQYYESYANSSWSRLDYSGAFNGYSLFAENTAIDPIIYVYSDGNIGVNIENPVDHFDVSANVIFLGDETADDISDIGDGDYFMWVANKSALRIGNRTDESIMWASSNIGEYSVGIGQNSAAPGIGSVAISFNEDTYESIASGSSTIIIGANRSEIYDSNSIVMASNIVSLSELDSSGNILLSASNVTNIGGSNNILLSGLSYDNYNLNDHTFYSNTISGGGTAVSPIGNNSFLWDSNGMAYNFDDGYDNSFIISPGSMVAVGINTNAFDFMTYNFEALLVEGWVSANAFNGLGNFLTGDIATDYLTVGDEAIYPTDNVASNYIYVSDSSGYLPVNSVSSQSILSESVTSDDINNFSITNDDISPSTISGSNFADYSITLDQLEIDNLVESVMSDIDSNNFEDDSVVSEKIATDSIYTHHFVDQAVTTDHIGANSINGVVDGVYVNNIALHAILNEDLATEDYKNDYFADDSATGRNIAHEVFTTTVDGSGDIIDSYIVYEDQVTGESFPQIQEHHINENSVISIHIPTINIDDRILDLSSIDTDDLTYNVLADNACDDVGNCIAIDRTVPSKDVFIGRHFYDEALTTPKFFDDPIENFQLQQFQIATAAVTTSEIQIDAILYGHINYGEIKGEHFIDETITTEKFEDNSVTTPSIIRDAIISRHIIDDAITTEDIALKTILGTNVGYYVLTSRELDIDSIVAENIPSGAIGTNHIIDGSLDGEIDFADDAFSSGSIADDAIESDDFAEDSITADTIGTNNISVDKISDGSIYWDDFPDPADGGYLPIDYIEDGSITSDKLCFDSDCSQITGDKITANAITADDIDPDATFSVDQLTSPLEVSKGGTGITSIANNSIIYTYEDPTDNTIKMGQTSNFLLHADYNYLKIGDTGSNYNNSFYRLITSGNVMVENGVLILDDLGSSFIFVTLNNGSIQFTNSDDLDSTESNMSLKVYDANVVDTVAIGGEDLTNTLTLSSGLAIGEGGYTDITPPTDGLIVSTSMQVGRSVVSSFTDSTYPLIVEDSTGDGIVSGVSDNIAVTSVTTDTTPPIISEGTVHSDGNIAIDVTSTVDDSPAISILMNSDSIESGIHSVYQGSACTSECSAIASILTGDTHYGRFGYTNGSMFSGIYGTQPSGLSATNQYTAYFDDIFFAEYLTDNDAPPTDNLTIDSLIVEESLGFIAQENIILSIDWSKGNIVILDVDNNNRVITLTTPPNESANLIVQVNHSGIGSVEWEVDSPYSISWLYNYEPELTASEDSVDFVIFYYSHETKTYYGGALYDFQEYNPDS